MNVFFSDIHFLREMQAEEQIDSLADERFIDNLQRHWEQFRKRERAVSDDHLWIQLPGLFLGVNFGTPATVENLPANMRIRNGIVEYKVAEEIAEDTNKVKVKCPACGESRVRKARQSEAASSSAE